MRSTAQSPRSMFSLVLLSLLLLASAAAPALAAHGVPWERLHGRPDCIGGSRCGHYGYALELPLRPGSPVLAVRFFAHDEVGNRTRGALRVHIDGRLLDDFVDIKRRGRLHEIDAHGLSGRYLVLEVARDDEVVIEDVEVLYGGHRYGRGGVDRPPYDAPYDRRRGAWRTLPGVAGCFGGERCGHYGYALEGHLGGGPIHGLRIYAHDDVGRRSRGLLRVVVDGRVLADGIDVRKHGGLYELAVPGLRGRHLLLEAVTNDEVVVDRVEILEGRRTYRRR